MEEAGGNRPGYVRKNSQDTNFVTKTGDKNRGSTRKGKLNQRKGKIIYGVKKYSCSATGCRNSHTVSPVQRQSEGKNWIDEENDERIENIKGISGFVEVRYQQT